MTNEQAKNIIESCDGIMCGRLTDDEEIALQMAIEALNFVSEHHQSNIETYAHDMGVSLEQAERELRVEELSCSEEPNRSDTIYRQDAIDATWEEPTYTDPINVLTEVRDRIKSLSSAQPERKKGEWIPVSETVDVPEYEVIACDKYGTELIGFLAGADGRYECESDECIIYDVVAWMPCPEPYGGES